ncbi:MAG: hypothetical protein NZ853_10590 [Leptospiraceae bacterium]|nr:hypothetical protein [Leptospiraceae bacterium]MDW7977100.1 amino acid--tRNA ligase-related protein [Leptospiraceae bacterium]
MPKLLEVQVFSDFLYEIRTFFRKKNFIEVETPLLNPFSTPEPHIQAFQIGKEYLITSPEFNLKTLVSWYKKNLFQIAHVFRKGDESKHHRKEFLMLEWYHIDYDHFDLMEEVKELLLYLSETIPQFHKITTFRKISIKELFYQKFQRGFHKEDLIEIIQEHQLTESKKLATLEQEEYDDLFFLVFLSLIEPKLETEEPLFLYGYPKELRAYSRLDPDDPEISCRFELYWKTWEIANGYYEISNPQEQWEVFQQEIQKRKRLHKPIPPISETFLRALPLPRCAGISIGLERLYLAFRNLKDISQISFVGKF